MKFSKGRRLSYNSEVPDGGEYYFDYLLDTEKWPRSVYHLAKHRITAELVAELAKGSRILDAGCGAGNISGQYCDQYRVYGVDEQAVAIDYCRKHYRGKYVKANLYQRLPFSDRYFDLILFHDSIEHFKEPKKVLKQLARVLKRGGKIVVSTINYANPMWSILENTWHRVMGGDCRTYSKEVHPTRYTDSLLREHCGELFEEMELRKEVLWMELFFVGVRKK